MDAIKELKKFYNSSKNTSIILSQLETLENQITAINKVETSEEWNKQKGKREKIIVDKVQTSNQSDRVGNLAAAIADKSEELKRQLDKEMQEFDYVDNLICKVDDGRMRLLLSLRYISGATFERIADMLDISLQWTFVLHKKAIEKIQDFLDS